MLTDLPEGWVSPFRHEYESRKLIEMFSGEVDPIRVRRGIYLAHINFHNDARDIIADKWPSFGGVEAMMNDDWISSYGVVDHWTQLPLKQLDEDPRPLLVYLSRHRKVDQPPQWGWRWHKWGPYLGIFKEQVSQHEYLYDTPDVDEVFSYCTIELKQ